MRLGKLGALIAAVLATIALPVRAQPNTVSSCEAAKWVAFDFLSHLQPREVVVVDTAIRSLNERFLNGALKSQGVDLATVRQSEDDAGGWVGVPPSSTLATAFMSDGSINAAAACPDF